MGNDDFRRELNSAFDDMAGSPSADLRNRVRSAVAEAPAQRGGYWFAAVAAVLVTAIIVGLLFINNPFRRTGLVGGNPTPTPSQAAISTPTPSPSPSPAQTPSPSPTSSAYICTADTLPQMSPKANPIAYVDDVRLGPHDSAGYERITIQFANGFPTNFVELTPRSGTSFNETASSQTIKLKGSNGILVRIQTADMHTSYTGRTDFVTGYGTLAEARVLEDFEGAINVGLGINGPACYHAYYLADPARLVIDVQVTG
jgi:hypothetical protein